MRQFVRPFPTVWPVVRVKLRSTTTVKREKITSWMFGGESRMRSQDWMSQPWLVVFAELTGMNRLKGSRNGLLSTMEWPYDESQANLE